MCGSADCLPDEWLQEWNRSIFRGMYIVVALVALVILRTLVDEPHATVFQVVVVCTMSVGVGNTFVRAHPTASAWVHVLVMCFMILLGNTHMWYLNDTVVRIRTQGIMLILWYQLVCVVAIRLVMRIIIFSVALLSGLATIFVLNRKFDDSWTFVQISTYFLYLGVFAALSSVFMHRLLIFYKSQQDLASEKVAVEELLCMTCDCKIWLASDGDTIHRSDLLFEDELRQNKLKGQSFSNACLPEQDDEEHARVSDAIYRANDTPVLLPTTLISKSGRRINVELLIVKRQVGSASNASFLIGVRFDKGLCEEEREEADVRVQTFRLNPERHQPSSITSAPSTSPSGVAVGDFENAAIHGDVSAMTDQLRHFKETGVREHWVVDFSKLQFPACRVLGVGSFGLVISATLHGTPVAVKVCRSMHHHDRRGLALLLHEIRVMRRIHHPNLVLLHGACIDIENAEVGLVFDRLIGVSLAGFATAPPSTSVEVCCRFRLAVDVIRTLRFLHQQEPPIVHMDISSSNVYVEECTSWPRAKLIDFGLSRLITRGSVVGGGTLNWAAPEVICCPKERPATSCDVFSFGRLLFMLMTSSQPLAGRKAILEHVHNGRVPPLDWPPHDIPFIAQVRDLCSRCCCFDACERPDTNEVVDEVNCLWRKSVRNFQKDCNDERQAKAMLSLDDTEELNGDSLTFFEAVTVARRSIITKDQSALRESHTETTKCQSALQGNRTETTDTGSGSATNVASICL